MRIALDPAPLAVGIYSFVGELLARVCARPEDRDAETLARRLAHHRREQADREIQHRVRALHAEVVTAGKLLRKIADIWEISRQTDLVELVIQPRGQQPEPRTYVLLQPPQIRGLLESIRAAARTAGEDEPALAQLENAIENLELHPGRYLAFGFDPWGT